MEATAGNRTIIKAQAEISTARTRKNGPLYSTNDDRAASWFIGNDGRGSPSGSPWKPAHAAKTIQCESFCSLPFGFTARQASCVDSKLVMRFMKDVGTNRSTRRGVALGKGQKHVRRVNRRGLWA